MLWHVTVICDTTQPPAGIVAVTLSVGALEKFVAVTVKDADVPAFVVWFCGATVIAGAGTNDKVIERV